MCTCPRRVDSADETPAAGQTPETYLGVGKMVNYGGPDTYSEGTADFTYPTRLADDTIRLSRPVEAGLPGRDRASRTTRGLH